MDGKNIDIFNIMHKIYWTIIDIYNVFKYFDIKNINKSFEQVI